MTYVFGPPSTASPAEKMGIVWCSKCKYEVLEHGGCCGWCDTVIRKEAA